MNSGRILWLALAGTIALVTAADARIKLATLPVREQVEVQLDNGRYTLVEEERIVPLLRSTAKAGNNRVDFSWSNATIDKDSILFRPLAIRKQGKFVPIPKTGGKPDVNVINVAYPPGENALVWEVYAKNACAVKVRVSYLISNLNRSFAYRALANKDETHLVFRNYIQLRNYSGEDFGKAGVWAGFGPTFQKKIQQQETIKMLLHKFNKVPITKTFTFDWYRNGKLNPAKPLCSRVLMHYELVNDEKNGMGLFPLQPGKVRIFIEDGKGGQAFLGEDLARLTPLDNTMRLYLGESRDIVCKRIIKKNERTTVQGNLHNQEITIQYEVENFKDKACTLDIVEQMNRLCQQYAGNPHGDAEWEILGGTSETIRVTTEEGRSVPKLSVTLPARPKDKTEKVEKQTFTFRVLIKNVW